MSDVREHGQTDARSSLRKRHHMNGQCPKGNPHRALVTHTYWESSAGAKPYNPRTRTKSLDARCAPVMLRARDRGRPRRDKLVRTQRLRRKNSKCRCAKRVLVQRKCSNGITSGGGPEAVARIPTQRLGAANTFSRNSPEPYQEQPTVFAGAVRSFTQQPGGKS
eukprot:6186451-Pleurochrysis_carterae.AAC.2